MSQQSDSGGWAGTLQDVFSNGLNSAIDRYLGPETAYQPSAQVPTGGNTPTDKNADRPIDATPGERDPMPVVPTQTLILGGTAVVLTIGLIVLLVRK